MSRRTVMPEVERLEKDPFSDSIERHPAYAQIGAARWTCGPEGVFLYGSDFRHNAGVRITISRSQLHRGLSNDWPSARQELIEVDLSEAQWATFVSTLNHGDGPQCTLVHVDCVEVPGIARGQDRKKQFKLEASEELKEAEAAAKRLEKLIEGGGRKTEMRDAIRTVLSAFSSHSGISYMANQFSEHIETVTEHAKVEVSAYIEGSIRRAGIAALGDSRSPIEFVEEKKSTEGGKS